MKKLILLTLIVANLANAQQSKIINGNVVKGSWYPWQMRIITNWDNKPRLCGGTLITPRWVLTAGHCFKKGVRIRPASDVHIAYGDNHQSHQKKMAVSDIIIHPQFNGDIYGAPYDIALVKLAKPLKQLPLMRLAKNPHWGEAYGNRLKTIGWGKTTNQATTGTSQLQIADLPLVNSRKCLKAYGRKHFSHGQLCAGDGVKDSCQGDSGGPLFRGVESLAVQYGLVSFGMEQCATKTPAVYTSVTHYLNWIKQQLGQDAKQLTIVEEHLKRPRIPQNVPKGNRALLIGVKDYYLPALSNLMGTEKDVKHMRKLLINYFDFEPEQIMTLTSEQATAENIRYVVKHWLIEQSDKDAKVWIYFSGHGANQPDIDGDEIDEYGRFDESILPYDTDVLTTKKNVENALEPNSNLLMNHILDDEVNVWAQALKSRRLTIMFDSCYSGTGYRSAFSNGVNKNGMLALNTWLAKNVGEKPPVYVDLPKGTVIPYRKHRDIKNDALVYWSATNPLQLALDNSTGGQFTNTFIRGVKGDADANNDGDITYAELRRYLKDFVKRHDPQLEIANARLNQSIFTGKPIGTLNETATQLLSQDNPHGLQFEWLDKRNRPVNTLHVGQTYRLRVSTQKAGWLLVYDLEDGETDNLNQYVPSKYSGTSGGLLLKPNQPLIIKNITMSNNTPSTLIGILLDSAEKANYHQFKDKLSTQRTASFNDLLRRDIVIGDDGKPVQHSVSMLRYIPKN